MYISQVGRGFICFIIKGLILTHPYKLKFYVAIAKSGLICKITWLNLKKVLGAYLS
jgi:hypothetical protein